MSITDQFKKRESRDIWIWNEDEKGRYNVKSAYMALQNNQIR